TRRRPRSTLFPYTTLFRSRAGICDGMFDRRNHFFRKRIHRKMASFRQQDGAFDHVFKLPEIAGPVVPAKQLAYGRIRPLYMLVRSEEHTSALQSRENLVCR